MQTHNMKVLTRFCQAHTHSHANHTSARWRSHAAIAFFNRLLARSAFHVNYSKLCLLGEVAVAYVGPAPNAHKTDQAFIIGRQLVGFDHNENARIYLYRRADSALLLDMVWNVPKLRFTALHVTAWYADGFNRHLCC